MITSTYQQLLEIIQATDVIDSHEHLSREQVRAALTPDFTLFYTNYLNTTLLTAGMPVADMERCFAPETPVAEKWRLMAPYDPLTHDSGYARAAHLAMRRFYGVGPLESAHDAIALTEAMQAANTPDLYQRVLYDACRIRKVVNCVDTIEQDEWSAPILMVQYLAEATFSTICRLEEETGICCASLSGYLQAINEQLSRWVKKGLRGIKFHFAYMRDLDFSPRTTQEAEAIFLRIAQEGFGGRNAGLGYEECRPLQDYLVHRLIEMAGANNLPVVFHTGMQAGIRISADFAHPSRLWHLPHRYPHVTFVLLHGGIPWVDECMLLAVHYPNVILDMAWMHIISPKIARTALDTWIDILPMNKIIGFGGDYVTVENVYGHLALAQQNIARVLAKRVDEDGMNFDQARAWIRALLWDTPNQVYRLGLPAQE